MNTVISFGGIRINYRNEGEGPVVIRLHGFGVDALGQFGDMNERARSSKKAADVSRGFGAAPPSPDPPCGGQARTCACSKRRRCPYNTA